jgi:hypothetical protein
MESNKAGESLSFRESVDRSNGAGSWRLRTHCQRAALPVDPRPHGRTTLSGNKSRFAKLHPGPNIPKRTPEVPEGPGALIFGTRWYTALGYLGAANRSNSRAKYAIFLNDGETRLAVSGLTPAHLYSSVRSLYRIPPSPPLLTTQISGSSCVLALLSGAVAGRPRYQQSSRPDQHSRRSTGRYNAIESSASVRIKSSFEP